MKKRIYSILMAVAFTAAAFAQSGTNSPYSQYGLGVLSDQSSGFNRGMNGLGLGSRAGNRVNFINPASYSALDSLTFIFDVGMSGQNTNFKEGNRRINAKNADFEYAVAGFRLFKNLGMSFGIVPFTNVGYNYTESQLLNNESYIRCNQVFEGKGGIHAIYLGAGWQAFKGFSVGANISYLWGDIERKTLTTYNDESVNSLNKIYNLDVKSYKLDFGMQYEMPISKKDKLTLGATFSLGHSLNAEPSCDIISRNPGTNFSDTTRYVMGKSLELPFMYGVGIMYNHNDQLDLGFDYSLQQWGSTSFPAYKNGAYTSDDSYFMDRHKFTFGGDYCADKESRAFLKRLHYRAGVSYATPYFKVGEKDGPKEISVSAGFGIPVKNVWGNRSMVNISGQWVHSSADGLITENTLRINIGVTFNERWFMKWKVR